MPAFLSSDFSFSRELNQFTSEASTLGIVAGIPYPNDFELESTRTRCRVLFIRAGVERDREGEVVAIRYRSQPARFTAAILND